MAITYEEHRALFEGLVAEDEAPGLREFLQQNNPQKLCFDLSGCADMHTAILQLLCAYSIIAETEILYPQKAGTAMEKALRGCRCLEQ